MSLYDSSTNTFISLQQLARRVDSYDIFFNGSEIIEPSMQYIQEILSDQSQKSSLMVCRKQGFGSKKRNIQEIFEQKQFANNFSQGYLQMIKAHPSSLFQVKLWNFEYRMDKSASEMTKERQEQLTNELIAGNQNWKQATLEQLQVISKNYHKMIDDSLK